MKFWISEGVMLFGPFLTLPAATASCMFIAEITGLTFGKNGMVILSASLDGTDRAYDLVRYRNFRTFTSPEPTQFASVAIDPSGEMVAAGCADTFEICLWSMKTGRLLDMLSGHTGPVSGLVFSPIRAVMASSYVKFRDFFWGNIFFFGGALSRMCVGIRRHRALPSPICAQN